MSLKIENQRLKEQIQEYESLMDNYPHGCLIVQEGRITHMNKTASKLLGCRTDDLVIGQEVKELVVPDDRPRALAGLNTDMNEEDVPGLYITTKSGDIRFVARLLSTSVYYCGQPASYYIIRDVFERTELSRSIIKSKAILQKTLDAIHDGIIVIDKNYIIRMINRKSLDIHCLGDFRKIIGQPCFKIFHKRSAPCCDCPVRYAFKTHKPLPPVERVIKQNGKEDIAYHLFMLPLVENGEVQAVVKYQRNIVREKELQEQLIHSEKLATLGILAGKIGHEINNPLSSIIGLAQLIACQSEDSEQLDLIIKEGLRIRELAQNLSALGRPSKNEMSDVVIQDVLDQVLSLTQDVFRQLKIYRFEKEYLPASPVVCADCNQIEQVFLNLVINASYAMKSNPGNGVLTVGTKRSPDGQFGIGYIKDNGCGIAEENKLRIFDPFFTTKIDGEGTGLGLSVVKEIVDKHRGRIEFESRVNQGTTFEIYLPLFK